MPNATKSSAQSHHLGEFLGQRVECCVRKADNSIKSKKCMDIQGHKGPIGAFICRLLAFEDCAWHLDGEKKAVATALA